MTVRPLSALVAAALLAGCSYDWTPDVMPAVVDASEDLPVIVPLDASTDETSAPPMEASVEGAPTETAPPVEAAPPSCATLQSNMLAALPPALSCTPSANACMTKLTDECGCSVVVQAGTPAQNYADAVTQFKAAGCSTTGLCSGSCPTPIEGQCLVADATAPTYACAQ